VRGATSANFGGNATSGNGLTVTSTSQNHATNTLSVISIGLSPARSARPLRRSRTRLTDASVTGPATLTGALTIMAISGDDAVATINGVTGAAIALGVTLPTAEAFGETRAYAGEGANVTATGATITASGTTNASATVHATSIGAISGGALEATANAGGIIDAFIAVPRPSHREAPVAVRPRPRWSM